MAEIIGEQNLYQAPTVQVTNAENCSITFSYAGNYESLLGRAPAKDTIWNEGGRMYTVLNSTVARQPGGMGEMSVACIPYQVGDAGDPTSEHYEIQFVETSQQLAFHKDFPSSCVGTWQKFLISPEHVQLQGKYCPDPTDEETTEDVDSELEDWAELYNKGIHEYMVFLPVVIRVRTYNLSPEKEVSNVGTLEEPEVCPSGFEGEGHWLKTGDNSIQEPGSGKWTRTETWTYAKEWPELLYQ